MTRTVVKALLALLAYLEFADDTDVNPDSAISQMEAIAFLLQGMTEEGRRQFLDIAASVATEFSNPDVMDFILGIGDSMGLTSD